MSVVLSRAFEHGIRSGGRRDWETSRFLRHSRASLSLSLSFSLHGPFGRRSLTAASANSRGFLNVTSANLPASAKLSSGASLREYPVRYLYRVRSRYLYRSSWRVGIENLVNFLPSESGTIRERR